MQTVICMKWGERYGPEFVNRLFGMVQRNTDRPTRLVCYTDDPAGLHPEIQTFDLPEIELPEEMRWTPWRKISLWRDSLEGVDGDCLFLDLDLVITGNLDDFFDHEPGKFCVILNWTQEGRGVGNTSAFRFRAGMKPEIVLEVESDPWGWKKRFRNEQDVVTDIIDEVCYWPREWCVSFKHTLLPPWPLNFFKAPQLPSDARIVVFTGKPDPDEALVGHFPTRAAWKKLYKHVRPTKWIAEHWHE
jgi:hypothetical protein